MSLTIWKFPLTVDPAVIVMPQDARVLTVAAVGGEPFVWAIVDPAKPLVERCFTVRGTGHEMDTVGAYVGTFMLLDGALVFHVFEGPLSA
jgi:hypothetical protein